MTIKAKNASMITATSGVYNDLYQNASASDAIIVSSVATCYNAAGMTVEMIVTDSGNVLREHIFPPASPLGYNAGYVETRKIVIPNGYKVRVKPSLAVTSGDNASFGIEFVEGIST